MSRIAALQKKVADEAKSASADRPSGPVHVGLTELANIRVRAFGIAARLAGWRAVLEVPFDGTPASTRYLDDQGRTISAAAIRDLQQFETTLRKLSKQNNLIREEDEPHLIKLLMAGATKDTGVSRALGKLKAIELRIENANNFSEAVIARAENGMNEEERAFVAYLRQQMTRCTAICREYLGLIVKPGNNQDLIPMLEELGVTEWYIRHVFVAELPPLEAKASVLSFFYGSEPFYLLRREWSNEAVSGMFPSTNFGVIEGDPRGFLTTKELEKLAAEKSQAQLEEIFGKIPVAILPHGMASTLVVNETTLKRMTNLGPRIPRAYPADKRYGSYLRYMIAHFCTGRAGVTGMEIELLRSVIKTHPTGSLIERLGDFHNFFKEKENTDLRETIRTNEENVKFVISNAIVGLPRENHAVICEVLTQRFILRNQGFTLTDNYFNRVKASGDTTKIEIPKFATVPARSLNEEQKALIKTFNEKLIVKAPKKDKGFFLFPRTKPMVETLTPAAKLAIGSIQEEALQVAAARAALFRLHGTGDTVTFQEDGGEEEVPADQQENHDDIL